MVDFDKIKAIYKFGGSLRLKDVQVLINAAQIKSFAAGDFLIQEGALKREVFFIQQGLVRVFTVTNKGEEITTALRKEYEVVVSPDIILFNQPSTAYFEALEPIKALSMNYDLLQTLIAENPKLEANRKYFFQNVLKDALKRIDNFVLLTPEERYLEFIKSNADLAERVHDKYIANILGITPVSLSRIRKRIATRQRVVSHY